MNFDQMARILIEEYSDARQLQVQRILENLTMDKLMVEQEINVCSAGRNKTIDLIERLTPQCQPHFRSDANKIIYLRKARVLTIDSVPFIKHLLVSKLKTCLIYTLRGTDHVHIISHRECLH